MNLKSKIFGLTAATALSLSMMTGVMAATDDDSAKITGSATLQAGICQIDVTQSNTNFGVWTYDGDKYKQTGGSNVSTIGATLKAAEPDGDCDVTISMGNGLSNGSKSIAPSNFHATFGTTTVPLPASGGETFRNVDPRTVNGVQLKLNQVPNTYAPGTYSGDIVLVVVNAD